MQVYGSCFAAIVLFGSACHPRENTQVGTTQTTDAKTDAVRAQAQAAVPVGAPVVQASPIAHATAATEPPPALPCEPYRGARAFRKTITRPEGSRSFEVRMPPPSATWPAPVLVAMHGYGGNPIALLRSSRLDEEASRRGYVTIAPTGYRNSFNGGDCCGNAKLDNIDDGGFVLAAVDEVAKLACVRTDHVNLTGFSNGAFMAQAMACEHADRIGSIASVSGMLGLTACKPSRPVSVLLVNGSGDPIIPLKGGGPYNTKSQKFSVDTWRTENRCDEATRKKMPTAGGLCERDTCANGTHVEACIVPYAHAWVVRGHPDNSKGQIDRTAREIMDFVVEHENAK